MLLILSALSPVAAAAGAAGNSTPVLGGGLAGPAAAGPAGLFTNPAAAGVGEGGVLFDLQFVYSGVEMQLEGEEVEASAGGDLIPALAISKTAGPVGFGVALMAPYGRGGTNDPDSSLRFYNLEGAITALEADLCVAVAPADWFSVGLAGRVASVSLTSVKAVDTGAMIAGLVGGGEEMLGDPFLEGVQGSRDGSGVAGGWAAGFRAEPSPGWVIAVDYRSQLRGAAVGDLSYIPSNALALEVTGKTSTRVVFPAEWTIAAELPAGPVTFAPELSWYGWSSWERLETQIYDTEFGSRDPTLDAILSGFGATFEELLASMESSVTSTGSRDIFAGGLGVRWALDDAWELRSGVWWTPATIPDAYVHPSNIDFAVLDLRGGAVWTSRGGTRLAVTGDVYVEGERIVTDTVYDPLADDATGLAGLPGDGRYALDLYRIGATVERRFGGGGGAPPDHEDLDLD